MSKLLVSLLQIDERSFRRYIDRLEQMCGYPSIDIKLSLEVQNKTKEKLHQLQINAKETQRADRVTSALHVQLEQDESVLKQKFKLEKSSPYLRAHKLAILATNACNNDRTLSITPAGCKRLMQAVPPKKTLRILKLRSLTSVTKREDPRLLYALAQLIEDETWKSQILAKLKRLPSKDLNWQAPEAGALSQAWYEKVAEYTQHHGLTIASPETGFVVVLPILHSLKTGMVTYALGVTLQAMHHFASMSAAHIRTGFRGGYETVITDIALETHPVLESVHGLSPTWHVVYELAMKGYLKDHVSEFSLLYDDLEWTTIESKLAAVSGAYVFWEGSYILGIKTSESIVSLHVLDVARNAIVGGHLSDQTAVHLHNSLWNELSCRYMQQDAVLTKLAEQLRLEEEFVV